MSNWTLVKLQENTINPDKNRHRFIPDPVNYSNDFSIPFHSLIYVFSIHNI